MALPQAPHFPNTHQELSLFSYIPSARQPQLLKILAGITGMAPESFLNHHLVYKSKWSKSTSGGGGGAADMFYLHLISRVSEKSGGNSNYKLREQRWSMRLPDFPEVTRKPVMSRTIYGANTQLGDVIAFVDAIGYTLQAPYFTDNFRFIHNNVIITLSRTYVPLPQQQQQGDEVFGSPFPRDALKLVDESGGWIMQAVVQVQNNTDVESLNVGVNELRALRDVLQGVCELDVVERLALDTRVR